MEENGAHTSDVSVLDHLPLQAGAFYIMDRGYIHFKRLYALAQAAAFFVVRARANMQFRRATLTRWTKAAPRRAASTQRPRKVVRAERAWFRHISLHCVVRAAAAEAPSPGQQRPTPLPANLTKAYARERSYPYRSQALRRR